MHNLNKPNVRVGIGVYVCKDGNVLIGKRKSAHAQGTWCAPGGHLENGETWEYCARREVREETGVEIKNVRLGVVTNDIYPDGKHYVTLQMISDWLSGEPRCLEPEKFEDVWQWVEWGHLPKPLMLSFETFLASGCDPFSH